MEVYSIHRDDKGALRFCTTTGLAVFEDDSLRPFLELESFLDRHPVHSVLYAGRTTWFGTSNGAIAWDGKGTRQLTTVDGLASDIVSLLLPGSDGTLWLGTHGGVSVLDSFSVGFVAPVPEVYLDSALAGEGATAIQERAAIPYADRTVVFRFNALSFVAEREMLFQWMVEGSDGGWQEPRKERQVRYTNLAPGSYVFRVRASNRNGQWSTPAAFAFSIRPPFWRTWWFVGICIAVVGSVLAVAYRFRVQQLLKVERMRSRIAADLHDDIASSLSSVAIYAAVIQQSLRDVPESVSALLDRIRDLSRESIENIGLIVWSVDPARDELTEVFRYFQRYAAQVTQAAGIEFTMKLPDGVASVLLTPEQRRTLFLILKESLNNALRHSRCSRIAFTGSLHGHMLRLALTDNGSGFSQMSPGGHGLRNMRSRGESIGARVEVNSVPGQGTTVAVSLRMA
jgi:signal transduction histidine kinase